MIFLPVTHKTGSLAAQIDSCDTHTQRMSSPTTNRTSETRLKRPRSKTIKKPSIWRRKPRSSILTRWTYRQLIRQFSKDKKQTNQNQSKENWSRLQNQFNNQAATRRALSTGKMVEMMSSMRNTRSTPTTRYHSTETQPTLKLSPIDRLKN